MCNRLLLKKSKRGKAEQPCTCVRINSHAEPSTVVSESLCPPEDKACRDLFPHHPNSFVCVCVYVCCSAVVNTHLLHALTFSSSCRSCLLLASLEHKLCSGATTVQMQRPSASWAELYTCQPSFGPIVFKCKQIQIHIEITDVIPLKIGSFCKAVTKKYLKVQCWVHFVLLFDINISTNKYIISDAYCTEAIQSMQNGCSNVLQLYTLVFSKHAN